jgi:hypothetical protein
MRASNLIGGGLMVNAYGWIKEGTGSHSLALLPIAVPGAGQHRHAADAEQRSPARRRAMPPPRQRLTIPRRSKPDGSGRPPSSFSCRRRAQDPAHPASAGNITIKRDNEDTIPEGAGPGGHASRCRIAQSTVTVYGSIDAGLRYQTNVDAAGRPVEHGIRKLLLEPAGLSRCGDSSAMG